MGNIEDQEESQAQLKLRDYQELLYKKCVQENLIICLPTGSGKTMIAIMVINYFLYQTKNKYPEVAKRTFFLAPKRALVMQQFLVLKNMVRAQISMITGDDDPDSFDKHKWMDYLEKNQVFVMTPDILLDILNKGYIKMKNINLIIFDEMHWAIKKGIQLSGHAYGRIISLLQEQNKNNYIDDQPRIISLSASIFSNCEKILSSIKLSLEHLETLFNSKIESCNFSYLHKYESQLIPFKSIRFNINIGFNFSKLFLIFREHKHITFLAQFRLAFLKIQQLLQEEMGIWFALKLIELYCNSLKTNHRIVHAELEEIIFNILQYIGKCIYHWLKSNNIDQNDPILINNSQFLSHKLQILLDLIKEFKYNLKNESFTGILFVSERTDANLLFKWLKLLSETCEEFNFLKTSFICGSFRKDFIKFDTCKDILTKLREKEINFIVATSVFEEGIDIPVCNFVIRYDGIQNYRSYCQSRGRARKDKSYFYIMVAEEEYNKIERRICNFKKMDEILINIEQYKPSMIYNEAFDNNVIKKDFDFEYFFSSLLDDDYNLMKPFINGESFLYPQESLQLLNKYLMKLPKDMFTTQKIPLVLFEKQFFENNSIETRFAYVFIFPINSTYNRTVIKGAYFRKKKKAAIHCAFRVCKFLIDKGEIDQNLNMNQEKFILERHIQELNIRYVNGSTNEDEFKTRKYKTKFSDYFQTIIDENSKPESKFYFYAIEFFGNFDLNLNSDLQDQFYKPLFVSKIRDHILAEENETIGILLLNKYSLDFIQSYFYFNLFQIKFEFKFCGEFDPNENESKFDQIKFFHKHVLNMIFEKLKIDEMSPLNSGLYIVPVKKDKIYSINFSLIQTLYNWINFYKESNEDTKKVAYDRLTIDQIKPYEPIKMDLGRKFTIFACIHQKSMNLYYIKNVSDVKSNDFMIKPNENCPNGQTYNEFYLNKYQRIIENQENPLINARYMKVFHINYHLIKQKATIVKNLNRKGILFPLELMTVYPLSSIMYLRIASLPMLLYRLQQQTLGKEFLYSLSKYLNNLNYKNEEFNIDDILLKTSSTKDDKYGEYSLEIRRKKKLIDIKSIIDNPIQNKKITQVFKNFLHENSNIDLSSFNMVDYNEENEMFQKLSEILQTIKLDETEINHYEIDNYTIEYGDVSIYKYSGDIDECIRNDGIKFNTFNTFSCPNPWHIVQGLTLCKANDSWNFERLEVIGDSFLKFTCSLYLFYKYPSYDEMKLTCLKMSLINNKNLFKIGMEKDITKYLFFSLNNSIPINFFKSLILKKNENFEDDFKEVLRFKDIADCIESLIGTFLIYGSGGTTLKFLDFLDLKSFDPIKTIENSTYFPDTFFQHEFKSSLQIFGPDLNVDDSEKKFDEIDDININKRLEETMNINMLDEIEKIYEDNSMNILEDEIEYKFNNKFLLVQAFTHPSAMMSEDYITGEIIYSFVPSFQRLEFIGDGILDYMITYYIYKQDSSLNPNEITMLRQALVNNTFYASISVKYGLHKFIRHSSFTLNTFIHKFVTHFTCRYIDQLKSFLVSGIDEEATNDINNVDIPKVLADIFEALIGAIYIDCHFDLDRTWKVVYKMIRIELVQFMVDVPLMPISRLYLSGFTFHFSELIDQLDQEQSDAKIQYFSINTNRKMIELFVDGVGTFIGYGHNKKNCKNSAAKHFWLYYEKKSKLKK